MPAPHRVQDRERPAVVWGEAPRALEGGCLRCGEIHRFTHAAELAIAPLIELFGALDADPAHAAFRAALQVSGGKMLGVLIAEAADGQRHVLRAHSGQVGATARWPGWAGEVLRREAVAELEAQTVAALAALTRALEHTEPFAERQVLRDARKRRSRALWSAMLDATWLTNAAGLTLPICELLGTRAIPGGTTECAVPRLLHAANRARLRPVAVAEAWWGPALNGRAHGQLQAPCARKCVPILGPLLCPRARP